MFRVFTLIMMFLFVNAEKYTYASNSSEQLGSIDFSTSVSGTAQKHFLRGVAALHSFWYTEALSAFKKSISLNPEFSMGYWGIAMAHNHPLWEEQNSESAKAALSKIKNISKLTHREQDYIQAIRLLYGKGEKYARDKAYSKAMEKIYRNYPNDLEAACFYSLSVLGVARNTVNKLRLQVEAGSIALEVFQKNPNHPCAAHYSIHAFDHPDLARLALPSAKRYSKIAPASHHAQHMSAHIFVQLGMWADAVNSNTNGWKTSVNWVKNKNLPRSKRDYHSLQWLHYSLLQKGLIDQAASIFAIQQKDMKEGIEAQSNLRAGKYYYRMLAASFIETENWEIIEKSSPPDGWKPKIFSEAGYRFALGFSTAMQGKIDEANKHLLELKAIRKQDFKKNHYKRIEYLKVWELEIQTAIKLYQKDFVTAIKLGKQAILLEEKLPSPSGPPRILKPTYEFLGEVYLKAGKPVEADENFSISLLRHPNRVRSLIGSARAANAKGDKKNAKEKYHQLFVQLANATSDFPELKEAKEFLQIN
ncbi:MAG: hypothetical protein VX429_03640 [Nitrospinota bacterium]|nr:hypothetical protein [Nitrospinota bacterium]